MTACAHAVQSFGGNPMTDVVYLCQNCGSVHELDSVRENRHSREDTASVDASRARRLTALQASPTAFTVAAGRYRVRP